MLQYGRALANTNTLMALKKTHTIEKCAHVGMREESSITGSQAQTQTPATSAVTAGLS